MILVAVAVRDLAVDAYMRPFFVPKAPMAVRSFIDEVRRKDGDMSRHVSDYALYEVGSFDEETGIFLTVNPARLLVRAVDVTLVE